MLNMPDPPRRCRSVAARSRPIISSCAAIIFKLCPREGGVQTKRVNTGSLSTTQVSAFWLRLLPLLLLTTRCLAGAAPEADATLPEGTALDWDKTTVVTLNPKRAQASLNGTWQFRPATREATEPPTAGWGYIKVPGSWG